MVQTEKTTTQKIIPPSDLVCMNEHSAAGHFSIDLAYARHDNLLLGQAVYRPDAKLWLHKDMAAVVLEAARLARNLHNVHLILYDGLRTVEAQALMLKTGRVLDNPQWLEPPRLLSPPGAGGHPRGMAVDVSLHTPDGTLLDMGTPFDFLAESPTPAENPAHRDFPDLSTTQKENRALLEGIMRDAAGRAGIDILPLPQEWWDFRLPPSVYELYAPLSDKDLRPEQRMT